MKNKIRYFYSTFYKRVIKIEYTNDNVLIYNEENKPPEVKSNRRLSKYKTIEEQTLTPEEAMIKYYLKQSVIYNKDLQIINKKIKTLENDTNIKELKNKFPEYFI